MLSRIIIRGLFNEIDYDLQLKDGPLTYIHSQNGQGKSTLMKLVCNVLKGNLEDVRTVPFQRLDLIFDNNTKLIVQNINEELEILMAKNRLEEELSQEDLVDILDATYIGPERVYTTDPDGNIIPTLEKITSELTGNIKKALADSELKPIEPNGQTFTDADLDMMFKNIEARTKFIERAGFRPTIPGGYRFPPTRFEIGEKKEGYTKLALSLKDYVDRYYQFAENISVFLDIVNTMYVNKTVEISNKGYLQAKMDKSGTIIEVNKFSSGEKQILTMFYMLLFKTAPGSLVIIDEPEVSLHISWQQQLGKFMMDIAKVRDLRLIVSTHSPSVIHDDWDLALELGPIEED